MSAKFTKKILSIFSQGKSTSKVIINGNEFSGNNIQILGDNIVVDGIVSGQTTYPLQVDVYGSVAKIETGSGDVNADNVGSVQTGSGDVIVKGDVDGEIRTGSGDVDVGGRVKGDVTTGSGDVNFR